MEVEDDTSPNMDISSLIDCCFLLLLYFIVCTSIVQERQLDMNIPGTQPSTSTDKSPLEPGLVTIDASGTIFWGKAGGDQVVIDTDSSNHELPNLVEILQNFKDKADSTGSKPIVQLRVDGTVPHQRFIDVMNAFTKGGIKEVGLTIVKDD